MFNMGLGGDQTHLAPKWVWWLHYLPGHHCVLSFSIALTHAGLKLGCFFTEVEIDKKVVKLNIRYMYTYVIV